MEKVITLINPLEESGGAPESSAITSLGEKIVFRNGELSTHDSGLATDLQERYPYLLDAPHDVFHPMHPMRVTTIALPWATYDERGRRIKNDLDTQRPT